MLLTHCMQRNFGDQNIHLLPRSLRSPLKISSNFFRFGEAGTKIPNPDELAVCLVGKAIAFAAYPSWQCSAHLLTTQSPRTELNNYAPPRF